MKIIQIKDIPIGFFAMTMALCGLALAWRLSGISLIFSNMFALLAIAVFIIVSCTYFTKFLQFRQNVKLEFTNPIMMSFFGTIPVSIMFLASIVSSLWSFLSLLLWILGASLHVILVLYTLGQWVFHRKLDIENLTPACFIPIVGLAVIPVYGAEHGFTEISWFFWGIGLALWSILLVFVLYRLMFVSLLPVPLTPTLFILLAPPSIIFNDYINLTGESIEFLGMTGNILYGIATLFACLLLTQIKQFILPFNMSYWAFTFPVVAFSMATMIMGRTIENTTVLFVGYIILFIATALIAFVFTLTVKNIVLTR